MAAKNNIKFNYGSTKLEENVGFIVDAFQGEGKTSGKPFYMFKAIVLNDAQTSAYCKDFFCEQDVFNKITDYGYYRIDIGGFSGRVKDVSPIEAVTI